MRGGATDNFWADVILFSVKMRRLFLHNAMWPGLVGKGPDASEPVIGLERMLRLTADARIDGDSPIRFDGVDLFLYEPHINIHAPPGEIRRLADHIAGLGLGVGSVVAPVYPDMLGGSAMGSRDDRRRFVEAVRAACEYASALNAQGVRSCGVIRIDSAASPVEWAAHPAENTTKIADTFREAADVAEDYGERIAAEGEICWAAMHSWTEMLRLLEEVGRPVRSDFRPIWPTRICICLDTMRPKRPYCKTGIRKKRSRRLIRS